MQFAAPRSFSVGGGYEPGGQHAMYVSPATRRLRRPRRRWRFHWLLIASIAIQAVQLATVGAAMPSIVPGTAMRAGPLAVCVALQVAQLLVAVAGFREVLHAALQRTIFLGKVWQQYVVQCRRHFLFSILFSNSNHGA